MIPPQRILTRNEQPRRPDGDWVVYWMMAARRPGWNFGLQRAIEAADSLGKPLVVVEPLSASYPWASARHSAFVLEGMRHQAEAFASKPVLYHPYAEPEPGAGRGLIEAWAERACLVVTDHWPCLELPRWQRKVAGQIGVRMEAIDSCGIMPLQSTPRAFPTAHAFRRFLQRELPSHLGDLPKPDPFVGAKLPTAPAMPKGIHEQWPAADLSDPRALAQALPIDQAVEPVDVRGGAAEASARMVEFLDERLESYTERNRPDVLASSGLSPWLHFGHASPHELLFRLAQKVGWSPGDVEVGGNGSREGWWRMPAAAESFLDELITWRELGHVLCHHVPNYGAYEELPPWALATLEEHAADPRPYTYTLEQFERAETHDPLWNAAQMQLREEGIIHNYLRMLWGKKILHWTRSPREALEVMVHLNNRWALDGRDPNSWAGIMWVLGRFDRAWGPERPVFGKVRYMTSDNTARKYNVKAYVARYQPAKQPALFED